MHVESADRSWTITKVVAVIVAILTAGYMLPWAIAAVRDVPHWGCSGSTCCWAGRSSAGSSLW